MILHTFDTITIDTYEAAINDVNALKRVSIYIPKKILNKRMDTITKNLNLLLSDNILSKEFEKLELLNKINILLPAIYNGFSACYKLAALTNKLPEQMSVFEELYERAKTWKFRRYHCWNILVSSRSYGLYSFLY